MKGKSQSLQNIKQECGYLKYRTCSEKTANTRRERSLVLNYLYNNAQKRLEAASHKSICDSCLVTGSTCHLGTLYVAVLACTHLFPEKANTKSTILTCNPGAVCKPNTVFAQCTNSGGGEHKKKFVFTGGRETPPPPHLQKKNNKKKKIKDPNCCCITGKYCTAVLC